MTRASHSRGVDARSILAASRRTPIDLEGDAFDAPTERGIDVASLRDERGRGDRFTQSMLDSVDIGVVAATRDGVVTFTNQAARCLLELSTDDGPRRIDTLFQLPAAINTLLGGERFVTMSHLVTTSHGTLVDLQLKIARSDLDEEGGFFLVFRDVSEEKRAAEERMRFDRLAAMGTMVAGFAHEVRNPVAALRSLIEEIAEELESKERTTHVKLMLQMIERIERLVRTALKFGRPAAPKRMLQPPDAIVSMAMGELRARLLELGGEVRVASEVNDVQINVDERQLAQALVIFLENALDATGASSRVEVRIRHLHSETRRRARGSEPPSPQKQQASIVFEVIDNGPGIPQELVDKIFDPFFTTKAAGTGLGLSIAQHIITDNGARLIVASKPNERTVFSIVVPVE